VDGKQKNSKQLCIEREHRLLLASYLILLLPHILSLTMSTGISSRRSRRDIFLSLTILLSDIRHLRVRQDLLMQGGDPNENFYSSSLFELCKSRLNISLLGDSDLSTLLLFVKTHGLARELPCKMTPQTTDRDTCSADFVVCGVNDYQLLAKQKLPQALYEYLASGSDNEHTLSENIVAFRRWYLRPRVLRPVGKLSASTTIHFSRNKTRYSLSMKMPLFISPAGVHGLFEPNSGECATALACGDAGILFGLSQHSTRSIEQVAAAAPHTCKWYQAYILKDRDKTLRIIQRAVNAGYEGLFLTVDSVRFGYREADARNGFNSLPPPHRLVNYDEEIDTQEYPLRGGENLESTYNAKKYKSWDQNAELMFEQNVTWDDVRWLKQKYCHIPLILKGIMTGEDAALAVEAGVDGIMVSNHGGRQLDGCLGAIDALPEVVAAVKGTGVHVFMDGGVRRGTDVLKALAIGASAVGIGKPLFFALAVGGQQAVTNMLSLFQREFESAMALCGCESVSDITSALVSRHPSSYCCSSCPVPPSRL
jgi:(S)-2-hydroxy-acid oxidase